MFLTKQQAQAVFDAMNSLNEVGAFLKAVMMGRKLIINVTQWDNGHIVIEEGDDKEQHRSKEMFAVAYDLIKG